MTRFCDVYIVARFYLLLVSDLISPAVCLSQAPIYHAMVVEMMYSCWGACVDPDPADPEQK